MTRVLYISTFQYSGSTLASFIFNTHTEVTTVGHTTGWNFTEDEDFRCSCGEPLDVCPFYRAIAAAYAEYGLPYSIRNFGTNYVLAGSDRLNRILTAGIPRCRSTLVENIRDKVVRATPGLSTKMRQCDRSNLIFMRTAIEYNKASVFVDNCHDPYRFRHLSRVNGLELRQMHLIRDPRGVVLSCRKNLGWDLQMAMRLWMNRQADIFRISQESDNTLTLYYEDLCNNVDETLARVHQFIDVDHQPYSGDFRTQEHHILGNDMRLKSGNIKLDTRWQRELSETELENLTGTARSFIAANSRHPLSDVLRHYFEQAPRAS